MRRVLGLSLMAVVTASLAIGPGQAAAGHVECGDVISEDTRLDSDLECTADTTVIGGEPVTLGLVIGADDVTLDLNGHEISGDGADLEGWDTGIVNGGDHICCFTANRGVTIRNGTIRDFSFGVSNRGDASSLRHLQLIDNFWGLVSRGDDVQIEGNSSVDSTGQGLVVGGRRNTIRKNVADGSDSAGFSIGANDGLFELNIATGSDFGMRVRGSGSVFRSNVVSGNKNGVVFESSGAARFDGNVVVGNDHGISVGDSHGVVLNENLVARNGDGIALFADSGNNLVRGNRIIANARSGLVVTPPGGGSPAHDNEVIGNLVAYNRTDGIFVGPASETRGGGNRVLGNSVRRNGDDGIDVEDPATTVGQSQASWNRDYGIEAVPGVIDSGGNRAFHNGNRLQCVNITCRTSRRARR